MTVGAIFDCDGVLIDSAHVWRDAEAELSHRAGAKLSREDQRALTTMTIGEVAEFFHSRYGLGENDADVVRMIDEIMLDFYANRSVAMPGIAEFLDGLAVLGVRMTVVSSSPQLHLQMGLGHVGLLDRFCSVLSVEDLHTSKREPLIYIKAMEAMGTTPAITWGFDDSYYAIDTMSSLGIATVGVYDAHEPFELERLRSSADLITCDYAALDPMQFARCRA